MATSFINDLSFLIIWEFERDCGKKISTFVVTKFHWKKMYSVGCSIYVHKFLYILKRSVAVVDENLFKFEEIFIQLTFANIFFLLTDLKNYYETWSNRILTNLGRERKKNKKFWQSKKMCGRFVVTFKSAIKIHINIIPQRIPAERSERVSNLFYFHSSKKKENKRFLPFFSRVAKCVLNFYAHTL